MAGETTEMPELPPNDLRPAVNQLITLLENSGHVSEVRVTQMGAVLRGRWSGRELRIEIWGRNDEARRSEERASPG